MWRVKYLLEQAYRHCWQWCRWQLCYFNVHVTHIYPTREGRRDGLLPIKYTSCPVCGHRPLRDLA